MKRINLRNYPFRLRLHLLPILVWLAAVGCVIGLFTRRSQRFEVVGMARGRVSQIAATSTGRLKDVRVHLFEQVKAGQTLAVIDTVLENESGVEAELQTQLDGAIAEIEHLAAQLVPTQEALMADEADREITRASEMRRLVSDAEQTQLHILELKAQIASDRVLLADLEAEVKTTEELVKEEAVAPYELQKAKVQYDSLAKKVEENQRLVEQAEQDFAAAKQRLAEFSQRKFTHPSVDSALEVIRKETAVQSKLADGLLKQLEALNSRRSIELKAPFDGIVIPLQGQANQTMLRRAGEDVIHRTGEVVRAGDPILAVAELKPSEIVAYVQERALGQVREDAPVEIIKDREPPQIARSQITEVGPTMELMPERMWLNPNVPQWGRPVVIKIPLGMELVAGELVGIRNL